MCCQRELRTSLFCDASRKSSVHSTASPAAFSAHLSVPNVQLTIRDLDGETRTDQNPSLEFSSSGWQFSPIVFTGRYISKYILSLESGRFMGERNAWFFSFARFVSATSPDHFMRIFMIFRHWPNLHSSPHRRLSAAFQESDSLLTGLQQCRRRPSPAGFWTTKNAHAVQNLFLKLQLNKHNKMRILYIFSVSIVIGHLFALDSISRQASDLFQGFFMVRHTQSVNNGDDPRMPFTDKMFIYSFRASYFLCMPWALCVFGHQSRIAFLQ